jgi:DNA mismatch repair protein MLH1
VSRELIPFKCASAGMSEGADDRYCMLSLAGSADVVSHQDSDMLYVIDGYLSNANYSSKKSVCVIFINNRLVECNSLRKTIESVYAKYLPKHTHPFIYLSLRIPPQHVDVNVHPTKKEVHFLHEDMLLAEVYDKTVQALCGANESRVFYAQTVLPSSSIGLSLPREESSSSKMPAGGGAGVTPSGKNRASESESQGYSASEEEQSSQSQSQSQDTSVAKKSDLSKRQDPSFSAVATATSSHIDATSTIRSDSTNKSMTRPYRAANKLVRTDPSASKMSQYFPLLHTSSTRATSTSSPMPSQQHDGAKVVGEEDGKWDGDETNHLPYQTVMARSCVCCAVDSIAEPQFCSMCSSQEISGFSTSLATFRRHSSSILKRKISSVVSAGVGMDEEEEEEEENGTASSQQSNRLRRTGADDLSAHTQQEDVSVARGDSSGSGGFSRRKVLPAIKRTSYDYESVQTLLVQIESVRSIGVKSILKKHTMVGIVNAKYLLVQHGTKLLLLDHSLLSMHLFYQLALRRFGEMRSVSLSHPVTVREFVRCALDLPAVQWAEEDGSKADIAEAVSTLLLSKAPMLEKYFAIGIEAVEREQEVGGRDSAQGGQDVLLVSVPEVLEGYLPQPEGLPMFLLRLATETDWDDETNCFADVARELALFYSQLPCDTVRSSSDMMGMGQEASDLLLMQLLPAIQVYLTPSRDFMSDGTVIQVTALEQLYKVFERC